MKLLLRNFFSVLFCLFTVFLISPNQVQAQAACNVRANIYTNNLDPQGSEKYYIEIFVDGSPEVNYTAVSEMNSSSIEHAFTYPVGGTSNYRIPRAPDGTPQWQEINKNAVPGGATLRVKIVPTANKNQTLCTVEIPFSSATPKEIGVQGAERCNMAVKVTRIPGGAYKLGLMIDQRNLMENKEYQLEMLYFDWGRPIVPIRHTFTKNNANFLTAVFDFDSGYEGKTHQLEFLRKNFGDVPGCPRFQDIHFPVGPIVTPPAGSGNDFFLPWNDGGSGIDPEAKGPSIPDFTLCGHIKPQTPERDACEACSATGADGKPTGIYSAIGCVKVDQKSMLRQLIQVLLGVSGLIALLSILAGAFLYTTSQGDTNKIKQAKELITAAVMGLFFIIFSTIILDFITVQVLRIPGLS